MKEKIPVIVIFDVGKTNKKIVVFDEGYKLVYEQNEQLEETKDEDGFPCEDVFILTNWIKESFDKILRDRSLEVRAVNFSAYGASFVYLDENLRVIAPLYNYLKPCSEVIQKKFYADYGAGGELLKTTASPALGNLNSGMQLYSLRHEKPQVFRQIMHALHLPQYLSFILTSSLHSDMTSIGCHTLLWNFQLGEYHRWVFREGIFEKLAPILSADKIAGYVNGVIPVGGGLHDSSAALIPYLIFLKEPFILLSTGTWCISLNPFNHSILSENELQEDCLYYLSHEGKPVKASRLLAGYDHEQQVKRLAAYFCKPVDYYTKVPCNMELLESLEHNCVQINDDATPTNPKRSVFGKRDLADFSNYENAYHQLVVDIVALQVHSTSLVLKRTMVKKIVVDGGFSKNQIYLYLMSEAFPDLELYSASVAQAAAKGSALAIHRHWNTRPLPLDILDIKLFTKSHLSEKG